MGLEFECDAVKIERFLAGLWCLAQKHQNIYILLFVFVCRKEGRKVIYVKSLCNTNLVRQETLKSEHENLIVKGGESLEKPSQNDNFV